GRTRRHRRRSAGGRATAEGVHDQRISVPVAGRGDDQQPGLHVRGQGPVGDEMSTFRIKRRTVLRGMLGGSGPAGRPPPQGAAVGLLLMEAMFNANGTALADGAALPRRLGVFFWGNGVKLDRWTPATTGANWSLSPELMPLTPIKDYVSVVSGMNLMTGNPQ